jgi:uncharacterized RDD family membrane protein YckC
VAATTPASLGRRLASAVYEAFSLVLLVFLAAFPMTLLTHNLPGGIARPLWQIFILLLPGIYLTWCWRRGQTLAMRAWNLRIESMAGGPPSRKQAWMRYIWGCLLLLPLGMGWWLAWLRADRQFLHDHLAGTRLVRVSAAPATTPPSGRPD